MSKHGIESPERCPEYRQGADARRHGQAKEACPFGVVRMIKRHLWLAGFIDMDIALGGHHG